MKDYAQARQWLLEAKKVQTQSGQVWVPTLEEEIARVTQLMGTQ